MQFYNFTFEPLYIQQHFNNHNDVIEKFSDDSVKRNTEEFIVNSVIHFCLTAQLNLKKKGMMLTSSRISFLQAKYKKTSFRWGHY